MKPCISQATTLKNPFEADPAIFSRNGWTDVEIWLTKLETFLQDHTLDTGPNDPRIRGHPTRRRGFPGRSSPIARGRARNPLEALCEPSGNTRGAGGARSDRDAGFRGAAEP